MTNIVLMGPPGAGKGTQAKIISETMGLIHISTGDLIRDEQAKNTNIGQLATQLADQGNFLPDNIVLTIVKQKIIDNPTAPGFIFDGFPRTVDQAKALDDFLISRKNPISKIIFLDITDDVVISRITERAAIENRPDDKPEVIQTRISNYKTKTMPVVNYYKNSYLFANNRPVVNIDATKSKVEVSAALELELTTA